MNNEEITKEDILNVTGSMFDTMFDYVDNSNKEIEQLEQENKQLKDNWNKLKEYCKTHYYGITTIGILEIMQELEEENNE